MKRLRPTDVETHGAGDLDELRLHLRLQRDLKNVGSFERLMHVALRLIAPHFDAPLGAVFAPHKSGRS